MSSNNEDDEDDAILLVPSALLTPSEKDDGYDALPAPPSTPMLSDSEGDDAPHPQDPQNQGDVTPSAQMRSIGTMTRVLWDGPQPTNISDAEIRVAPSPSMSSIPTDTADNATQFPERRRKIVRKRKRRLGDYHRRSIGTMTAISYDTPQATWISNSETLPPKGRTEETTVSRTTQFPERESYCCISNINQEGDQAKPTYTATETPNDCYPLWVLLLLIAAMLVFAALNPALVLLTLLGAASICWLTTTPASTAHLNFGDFELLRSLALRVKLRDMLVALAEKRVKEEVLERKRNKSQMSHGENRPSVRIAHTDRHQTKLFVDTKINNVPVAAQLDCGAERSLLSRDLFCQMQNHEAIPTHEDEVILRDHSGNEIPQHTAPRLLTVRLGNQTFQHPFYVTSDEGSCLFGLDLMKRQRLNIAFGDDEATTKILIGDILAPREIINTRGSPTPTGDTFYTAADIHVKENETTQVPVYVHRLQAQSTYTPRDVVLRPTDPVKHSPLSLPDSLHAVSPNTNYITVKNHGAGPVLLPANFPVADIRLHQEGTVTFRDGRPHIYSGGCFREATVHQVSQALERECILPADMFDDEDLLEDVEADPNAARSLKLDKPQIEPSYYTAPSDLQDHPEVDRLFEDPKFFPLRLREGFRRFLKEEVPSVISKNEHDAGHVKSDIEFNIDLTTDKPITARPYFMNGIRHQQMEKILSELCEAGILKRGEATHTSPLFLVSKPPCPRTGVRKIRMVCNYRKLNEVSMPQNFPIPDMNVIINRLAGSTYYTSLDLRAGFHSVPLSPSVQQKAAMIAASGVYLPQFLTFGLRNAPSAYCRIITKILAGLDYAIPYLDDTIIYSSGSLEDHVEKVKTVVRRFHSHGVKLNLSKCSFALKEIHFLGRRITGKTIAPLKRHVHAIQHFPRPQTVPELRRFLGLLNWVSCWVPRYAERISTLCSLLKKDSFDWRDEHTSAFEKLREAVTERTVKFHPDFTQPLYVATDASDSSYSAVAWQTETYTTADLERLKNQLAQSEHDSHSPVVKPVSTTHPILPPSGKRTLREISLFGKDTTEKTRTTTSTDNLHTATTSNNTTTSAQKEVHVIRPVGFYSGLWHGPQRSYTILERECLATILGLENFRDLAVAVPQTYLLSDSSPLLYLLRFKGFGLTKVERYIIRLLSLPFKIVISHCSSVFNPADSLSRTTYVAPKMKPGALKRAKVVTSPFDPGDIVEIADIINALESHPQHVVIGDEEPLKATKPKSKSTATSIYHIDSYTSPTPGTVLDAQNILATPTEASVNIIGGNTPFGAVRELQEALHLGKIAAAQRTDEVCKPILRKLEEGESLTQKKQRFTLHQGILRCTRVPKSRQRKPDLPTILDDPATKIYLPKELLGLMCAYYHYSTHMGGMALAATIKADYYHPALETHTRRFTSACALCLRFKAKNTGPTELGHTPLPSGKLQRWSLDFVLGLAPVNGFDAYLSAVDTYSGMRVIVPASRKSTSQDVTRMIAQHIIAPFGLMTELHSDQGRNLLAAQHTQKWAQSLGIKLKTSTSYSPKSHGRVEVSNRYVTELTNMLTQQQHLPWPDAIPLVTALLNSKPLKHMRGLSPFEIVYGRRGIEPPLPIREESLQTPEEHARLLKDFAAQLKTVTDAANEQIELINQKVRGRPMPYKKDDLVYIRDHSLQPQKKTKQKFVGSPHLVVHTQGPVLWAKNWFGQVRQVHTDHCRPCPPRAYDLYAKLPLRMKSWLGGPVDEDQLRTAIKAGEILPFWDLVPPPLRAIPLDDSTSGEAPARESSLADPPPPTSDPVPSSSFLPKRVTFNL